MKRFLPFLVLSLLLVPVASFASIICLSSSAAEILGDDMVLSHPNIHGGTQFYAGTLNGTIDCTTPTLVYCVDSDIQVCFPAQYVQGPDITSPEIVWILNNYYPVVPGMPSELSTFVKRKAAVQLALWHFSDGVDISTGGSDPAVFAAANAIIAAAQAQSAAVPSTPTSLVLDPPYTTPPMPGTLVTVTATLYDQNGIAIPYYPISYSISLNGSGSGMTDEDGQFSVSWTEVNGGDVLTFSVDYTIPIGLSWTLPGCQDMIQGVNVPGHLTASWGNEGDVGAESSTWGSIKNLDK